MIEKSPLGQATVYKETYSPELLFPIPRQLARDKISLSEPLPFNGVDLWSGYEISWLNLNGKPQIALAEFSFPFDTPYVIESKSFKLYLNSLNQSHYKSIQDVEKIIQTDLSNAAAGLVTVSLFAPNQLIEKNVQEFSGICLDALDIHTDSYEVNTGFLLTDPNVIVDESLYSDLLKSNCLATGQPDWGSVFIHYVGPKIDHEGLLKYIISYRRHSGFAEHCTEQLFNDISNYCKPQKLTVYTRYTRRGGLDINPFRSNFEKAPCNHRQYRQ